MPYRSRVPAWFWVLGCVMLAWNLTGVMVYISQVTMSPEALAALPAPERELYESTPAWANAAFAFAVWAGAAGCLVLLLRRAWAFYLLLVSLLGVLVQMFHAFFISRSFEVYGPGAAVMPMMIIVIAAFLVWFSIYARKKAWLG